MADEKIHFVGNVIIDSLLRNAERSVPFRESFERFGRSDLVEDGKYGVVTLHRPSNVDDPKVLTALVERLERIAERIPLVFAVHPRTSARLEAMRWTPSSDSPLAMVPPLGYLEMAGLMKDAAVVLTDSGGMQEETTALGVPCLTVRENTERPITVTEGTNTVVGSDPERIEREVDVILTTGGKAGKRPELWDGKASERIRDVLLRWLEPRGAIEEEVHG